MAIDANGVAGGLRILWNPNEVNLVDFVVDPYTIFSQFHVLGSQIKGIISNVYDRFKWSRCRHFWTLWGGLEYGLGVDLG